MQHILTPQSYTMDILSFTLDTLSDTLDILQTLLYLSEIFNTQARGYNLYTSIQS